MLRSFVRTTAISLSAVLFFSGMNLNAQASGVSSVLPSGGINVALSQGTTLENIQIESGNSNAQLETIVEISETKEVEVEVVEEVVEESLDNIVVAQTRDYINVRSTPSQKGSIIGKFYDDAVGTILSEQDGWYEIQSGNVVGFVKADLCVVGEEARVLAQELGNRMASVQCDGLVIRQEANADSTIIRLAAMGDELLVLEETADWVKVDIEEGEGWVAREFVKVYTEYIVAESKEEEAKRLEKEQAARDKARISAAKLIISSVEETDDNAMGIAVAEYAIQFIGNPYVWGGTSLTEGADCSGFVMKIYEKFGVELPHSSAADRKQGYAVKGGLKNAQPGDLICYSGHVALYIGDGQIVHAASAKSGIKVSKADYRQILAIRRIF